LIEGVFINQDKKRGFEILLKLIEQGNIEALEFKLLYDEKFNKSKSFQELWERKQSMEKVI
jgi:hypothetical protein